LWQVVIQPPRITGVQIDPDTRRAIQVRYGNDAAWVTLHEFPPNRAIRLSQGALANLGIHGRQIVAAGSETQLDDESNVLAAFDSAGEERWRIPLHSERWPAYSVRKRWGVVWCVLAADVDGAPGDEFIVGAHDRANHPSRISLINAGSGEVSSSFWHFGHLHGVRVVYEYFDDGRPAILAWGLNGRLDAWETGPRPGERQFAHWDVVAVVMVLDPREMNGVGPPATDSGRELVFPFARPWAYAFMDLPYTRGMDAVPERGAVRGQQHPKPPAASHSANIQEVRDALQRPEQDSGPWFELIIVGAYEGEKSRTLASLIVDRNLELRLVGPSGEPDKPTATKEYWNQYWHPIIQNGVNLD
jgi:hypothetical protein